MHTYINTHRALSWSYKQPAFIRHYGDEEEKWFNQASCLHHSYYDDYPGGTVENPGESQRPVNSYPHDTCYGDGLSPQKIKIYSPFIKIMSYIIRTLASLRSYLHVFIGPGTAFTDEEVQCIRARIWERVEAVTWSKGDLLIMDNTRVAHGRMSFHEQSKRSILVALTD